MGKRALFLGFLFLLFCFGKSTTIIAQSAYSQIVAGNSATYVVGVDGKILKWGSANYPQGTITDVSSVYASGMGPVFVTKNDGSVWGWGANYFGQLGNGTSGVYEQSVPSQVVNLSGVKMISSGDTHVLAVKQDGTLWSWGSNQSGELGYATEQTKQATPKQVNGMSGIVAAAAGDDFSIALKNDGTLWGWGNNRNSILGTNSSETRSIPAQITGLTSVTDISCSETHCLAVQNDGTLVAWGRNTFGQLGDGTEADRSTPVPILDDVNSAEAFGSSSVALKEDGSVWTWGANGIGQLGDGSTINRKVPGPLKDLKGIVKISAGRNHAIAILQDGSVWGWGTNGNRELGNGSQTWGGTPSPVPALVHDSLKLKELKVSDVAVTPAFNPDVTTYSLEVPNDVLVLSVSPTVDHTDYGILVNGERKSDDETYVPIPLLVGMNRLQITVTDGVNYQPYLVEITRAPSSDASLKGLTVSGAVLTHPFSEQSEWFGASADDSDSVTVTVLPASDGATVKINGVSTPSGSGSELLSLRNGDNIVNIEVTAQDGVTVRNYRLIVSKGTSSNAFLHGITVSAGYLDPMFHPDRTQYQISVSNKTSELIIFPAVLAPHAAVTVNGVITGQEGVKFPLIVGDNTFHIVVSAQDGQTEKTYQLKVVRLRNSDSSLSSLTLTGATLEKDFDPNIFGYMARHQTGALTVDITPTARTSTSTIKVNGTAVTKALPDVAVNIVTGVNRIKIEVTAEDGTHSMYSIAFVVINPSDSTDEISLGDELIDWIWDESSGRIYAWTEKKVLVSIRPEDLYIEKSLPIGRVDERYFSFSTDMEIHNGNLYVIDSGSKNISVIDLDSFELIRNIATSEIPEDFALNGDLLYYISRFGSNGIREINLTSGTDRVAKSYISGSGELTVDAANQVLYFGSTGSTGSNLYAYRLSDFKQISQTTYDDGYGFTFPEKSVILDGNEVYYAGHRIDRGNLAILYGTYREDIRQVQGSYIIGERHIFSKTDYIPLYELVEFPHDVKAVMTSAGSVIIYQSSSDKINRITPVLYPKSVSYVKSNGQLTFDKPITDWVADPSTGNVYAVFEDTNELIRISSESSDVTGRAYIGSRPKQIELHDGKLMISLGGSTTLTVWDKDQIVTGAPEEIIVLPGNPDHFSVAGSRIYFTIQGDGRLYEYDRDSKQIRRNASMWNYSADLFADGDSGLVYLANAGDVYVYRMTDLTLYRQIPSLSGGNRITTDDAVLYFSSNAYGRGEDGVYLAEYGQPILFADQSVVIGTRSVLNKSTTEKLFDLPSELDGAYMLGKDAPVTLDASRRTVTFYGSLQELEQATEIQYFFEGFSTVVANEPTDLSVNIRLTGELGKFSGRPLKIRSYFTFADGGKAYGPGGYMDDVFISYAVPGQDLDDPQNRSTLRSDPFGVNIGPWEGFDLTELTGEGLTIRMRGAFYPGDYQLRFEIVDATEPYEPVGLSKSGIRTFTTYLDPALKPAAVSPQVDEPVKWVLTESSDRIYALSQSKKLNIFRTSDMQVEKSILLTMSAKDFTIDGNLIYVSFPAARSIKVYDMTSGEWVQTILTAYVPDKVFIHEGVLYYSEAGNPRIGMIPLNGGSETNKYVGAYNLRSISLSEDHASILFLSGNGTLCPMKLGDLSVECQYSNSITWIKGADAFAEGKRMPASNTKRVEGTYGEAVVEVSGDHVFSSNQVFDKESFYPIGWLPHHSKHILSGADGSLYMYNAGITAFAKYQPDYSFHPQTGFSINDNALWLDTSITDWVFDSSRNLVYGVSAASNRLIIWDAETLLPAHEMFVGSRPSDIEYMNDKLYIGLGGATKVSVVDLLNQYEVSAIWLDFSPYRIEVGADYLYYTGENYWEEVHSYRFADGTITRIMSTMYYPELLLDRESNDLYASSNGTLFGVDVLTGAILEASGYYSNDGRWLVKDGSNIYYAKQHLLEDNLKSTLGSYGDYVIFANGTRVMTQNSVYDRDSHTKEFDFKLPAYLILEVADEGLWMYNNQLQKIFRYSSFEELKLKSGANDVPDLTGTNFSFSDTDFIPGKLAGYFNWLPPGMERNITHYVLHFINDNGQKLGPAIVEVPITGTNSYSIGPLNGIQIPYGAKRIGLFTKNDIGISLVYASYPIWDNPVFLPLDVMFRDSNPMPGIEPSVSWRAPMIIAGISKFRLQFVDRSGKNVGQPIYRDVSNDNGYEYTVSFTPEDFPEGAVAYCINPINTNGEMAPICRSTSIWDDISGERMEDAPPVKSQSYPQVYFARFFDLSETTGRIEGELLVLGNTVDQIREFRIYYLDTQGNRIKALAAVKPSDRASIRLLAQAVPPGAVKLGFYALDQSGELSAPYVLSLWDAPGYLATIPSFVDTDSDPSFIGGVISWRPAADERNLGEYVVWFSNSRMEMLGLVGRVGKGEGNYSLQIPNHTPIPNGATHLAIFSVNGSYDIGPKAVLVPIESISSASDPDPNHDGRVDLFDISRNAKKNKTHLQDTLRRYGEIILP